MKLKFEGYSDDTFGEYGALEKMSTIVEAWSLSSVL